MSEVEYEPDWLLDKRFERWEIPNPEIATQEKTEEVIYLLTEKIEKLKKTL
jgi:protein-tyrosine-phosphatase